MGIMLSDDTCNEQATGIIRNNQLDFDNHAAFIHLYIFIHYVENILM